MDDNTSAGDYQPPNNSNQDTDTPDTEYIKNIRAKLGYFVKCVRHYRMGKARDKGSAVRTLRQKDTESKDVGSLVEG